MKLSYPYKIVDYKEVNYDGWTVLGAGGGGSMFFPAISPFSNDVLALTCDMTGTYFSYDGGKSWIIKCVKSRVDSIIFDPRTVGLVYAGSSGLFKSTDNGHNWDLIFPHPDTVIGEKFIGDEALHFYLTKNSIWPGGKVQIITVDPVDPNNIYIGIATGSQTAYDGDELLIYQSNDAGVGWSFVSKIKGNMFKMIYVNHNGASQKRNVFVISDAGFYKLGDRAELLEEIPLPENINKIYQATAGPNPESGESVFYITSNASFDEKNYSPGVYRSTDYGLTWVELAGLDLDYYGPANGQFRRYDSISCSVNDARKVYLGNLTWPETKDNPQPEPNFKGILISCDLGETWDWSMKIGFDMPDNTECGWYEKSSSPDWWSAPLYITVSPSDPEFAFCVTPGTVLKTKDGGASWQQIYCQRFEDEYYYGSGLEVTGSYSMHFDPFNKNNLYITCADNGLLKSKNGGKTWKKATEGVPFKWINSCYQVVFDPDIPGKTWSIWSGNHNIPRENIYLSNYFYIHAFGGVCKSTGIDDDWIVCSDGLPTEEIVHRSIALDTHSPAENRTLYIACNNAGVYKSVDDGNSWTAMNKGIEGNMYTLKILLTPDGTLYVIMNRALEGKANTVVNGAIYKSTDGAHSWDMLQLPQGTNGPSDIDYAADGKTIYLTCWPSNDAGCNNIGGVYKSTDGCISWDLVYDTQAYICGVTTDKDNLEVLYIATFQNTVLRSDDAGSSWKRIKGYDFKWNHKVILDPYDKKKIYVATFGSSVWHGPNEVVDD